MKVLIVGNGIAGNEVAFRLRKARSDLDITIVSAERFPEYDPCSLPYFIGRRCAAPDRLPQDPG